MESPLPASQQRRGLRDFESGVRNGRRFARSTVWRSGGRAAHRRTLAASIWNSTDRASPGPRVSEPAISAKESASAPRRVALLSGHYYPSKRRAGFHNLADAYWRAGFEVIFMTTQVSWISWLRRDHRFQYPILSGRRRAERLRDRFTNYVWFTPWHPANLRINAFNRLTGRVVRKYADL